jgi:ABC-2 type transport system permease protein
MNRTIMWLTWRQLFAKRRIWIAIAFALVPLAFTLLFRLVADDGDASRVGFYHAMVREIIVGSLLPLAAVTFGTTAFGGEIDDGTLIYLLVKPIRRWQVVVSKLVVSTLSTFAVVVPAIVLPWFIVQNPDLPFKAVTAFLTGAALASVLYSAFFVGLGLRTKRALVFGLLYVIGFEGLVTRSAAGTRALSIREFANSVAQAVSSGSITIPDAVSLSTVRWMASIILVASTVWAMWMLARYEVAERL